MAEITEYLDLSAWPAGTRAICRREEPHAGAQCNIFEPEGWRHQVFITNSTDADIVYLEARHRGHARVEDRIKTAKALGLYHFPSHDFAANAAWLLAVLIACDLTAWTQGLCLTGAMAKAEPKKLRWALWHTAGKITTSGRRRQCTSTGPGRGPPPCNRVFNASAISISLPEPTNPSRRCPPANRPAAVNASPKQVLPASDQQIGPTSGTKQTPPRSHRNSRQQGHPRLESLKLGNSSVNLVTNSRG